MSDRTTLTVLVKTPEVHRAPVLELITRDSGIDLGGDTDSVLDNGMIILSLEQERPGAAEDLARRLADYAEEKRARLAFKVWEDPVYEWLGQVVIQAPGHELFTAPCDVEGTIRIAFDRIQGFLDDPAAVRAVFGADVEEAWQNCTFHLADGSADAPAGEGPANSDGAERPGSITTSSAGRYRVRWEIDDAGDSTSPVTAAAQVWTRIFGRRTAAPDDACVFTVVDLTTGATTRVDLSEHDLGLGDPDQFER